MDYTVLAAVVVLISACIAAGVVAGVVHTWSLRASHYSLESRVAVVEGVLQREVKARAGQERWKKADKTETLFSELAHAGPPKPTQPWWFKPEIPREFRG